MEELKFVFYNVFHSIDPENFSKGQIVVVSFDEQTTVQELLKIAGEPCADLSQYYGLSRGYCYNNRTLPFLISNGRVLWDVLYQDAKVIDFLTTHEIKDYIIKGETGIPQAGGIGIRDLAELWKDYYPILDQIATVLGLGTFAYGFGRWIKSLFKSDTPPPAIFDFLLSRKQWNHFELSEYLGIDPEKTQNLLKAFCFKWDNKKKLYIKQPESEQVLKELSKVPIEDDLR